MAHRYRLSSLLNLVVLICFLLWISTLEGGADILGGLGFWLLAGLLLLFALLRIWSYVLGTLGERQRKNVADQTAKGDK